MNCEKCGLINHNHAKFCRNCGEKLVSLGEQVNNDTKNDEIPEISNTTKNRSRMKILVFSSITTIFFIIIMGILAYRLLDPNNVDVQLFFPGKKIEKVEYLHLKNKYLNDIIVQASDAESKGLKPCEIGIISFNYKTRTWELSYESILRHRPPAKTKVANILGNGTEQIIFYGHEGSGGFLFYRVIGFDDNEFKVLLDRSGIARGEISIEGDTILEKTYGGGIAYKWNGSSLIGTKLAVPATKPVGQDDKVVKYSISKDGNVYISESNVSVQVGKKLQLIKEEGSIGGERIMMSGGGGVLTYEELNLWTVSNAGKTTIEIVPNYSDWNKKKVITINALAN